MIDQYQFSIFSSTESPMFIYVFNLNGSLKTEISISLLAAADVPN